MALGGDPPLPNLPRLGERLARERLARRQAEDIAERVTRELYHSRELVEGRFRTTLGALTVLSRVAAAGADFGGVSRAVADGCTALFGATLAQVWIDDPVARVLRPEATSGFDPEQLEAVVGTWSLPYDTSLGGRALLSRTAIFVPDVQQDPRPAYPRLAKEFGLRACAVLPLVAGPRALGVLSVFFNTAREFGAEEKELMGLLADYTATSLQRARLLQELERSYAHLQAAQAQLLQAQKLEAISRVTGGLAHDFNNLLAIIRVQSEVLEGMARPGTDEHDHAAIIRKAVERGATLTRQLLDFARPHPAKFEVLDIGAVVTQVAPMLRSVLGKTIELHLDVPGPQSRRVKGDQAQLEQVLLNLAINSRDAMPAGGRLTIATEHVDAGVARVPGHPGDAPGPYVRLTVTDTGTGMDEETLAHALEPFFTTKGVGIGTGLGLASVYGIVQQHNGKIELESAVGRGTTVAIWLPTCDPAADGEGAWSTPSETRGRA